MKSHLIVQYPSAIIRKSIFVIFITQTFNFHHRQILVMKKASNYAYVAKKSANQPQPLSHPVFGGVRPPAPEVDLNVFVLTFDGTKEAQKNLAGGDPYWCKKCGAILNKFSLVLREQDLMQNKHELKPNQSLWSCQFCNYPNVIMIEKQEIPIKDDVVYMLESALEHGETENDSTIIFCIDISGSMNTTSEIAGKVELKFGLSKEEIEMLKQFMEPGDQAQFNFLPGAHNQNKTFISRMQCVLSAIESQINEIRKVDPHKKVGFILFNDQVMVLGDGKTDNVSLVGDRLNSSTDILNALKNFKLTSPIAESYEVLLNRLNKTQAKGQTALGPALTAAIQVASNGSKGSVVVLCTDGLANIGIGALEMADESKKLFYKKLGDEAKEKNVSVNIITIKGESSKLEILGQIVEATNGNVKVVNPEKLSQDFANILKDEVIGLNVQTKIMLHKALVFRNEQPAFLKDNKTILIKPFANATVKTKISFEYEVRDDQDLKFMEIDIEKLQKVPFQAQITYTSPKGGKFLRVISSQSKTTTERKEMQSSANIGVVHQRIASNTAQMYARGQKMQSASYNNQWSNYLNNNFQAPQYQMQQEKFNSRNRRLNEAISNKMMKEEKISQLKEEAVEQEEEVGQKSSGFFASLFSKSSKPQPKKMACKSKAVEKKKKQVDSDEDEMDIKNFMMEKNEDFE